MTSKTTVRMPAQVVVLLRGALYTELQRACEDAPASTPEYKTRRGWAPVLGRIDAAVGALDVLGWEQHVEQRSLTITLNRTMVEALETDAEGWGWLSEQVRTESAEGRARAAERAAVIERFLARLPECPERAQFVIPAAAMALVREGGNEALTDVAEAIDRGVEPRECCRRLTWICDLPDPIGWNSDEAPGKDVDGAEHARAVMELAPAMLATLRTGVSDLEDADPSKGEVEAELRLLSELHVQASALCGN